MIGYIQETDSRIAFPLLGQAADIRSRAEQKLEQCTSVGHNKIGTTGQPTAVAMTRDPGCETTGATTSMRFFPVPRGSSLIHQAWGTIEMTRSPSVAGAARSLLVAFERTVVSFALLGLDVGHLPPLKAFNLDDDSAVIEWIFRDFRIGFNIEAEMDESGWYLVSNETLGGIGASGRIAEQNLERLLLWLLDFAFSNT